MASDNETIQSLYDSYQGAFETKDPEQRQAALENLNKDNDKNVKDTNKTAAYASAHKRRFAVEQSNWGPSLEERMSPDFQIGRPTEYGTRVDKFRQTAGKYWSRKKELSDFSGRDEVMFISKGPDAEERIKVPFKTVISTPFFEESPDSFGGERDPFFEVNQLVVLTANKNSFKDEDGKYRFDNWKTLIEGFQGESATGNSGIVDEQAEYRYLAFDMELPFNYRQLDSLNIAGPQYMKIRPEYNFYIKSYEEQLRFGDLKNKTEAILPGIYPMLLERKNEKSNKFFYDHISLNNTLTDSESTLGAGNKFDIKKHSGQYFDLYGFRATQALTGVRSYNDTSEVPTLSGELKSIVDKYKNMIVPIEQVPLLKELSDKKELFPMFVDMELSTDITTELAQTLDDTKLYNEFMWSIVKDSLSGVGHTDMQFTELEEFSTVNISEDGTNAVSKRNRVHTRTRKVWDIFDSWLKKSSLVDFTTGELAPGKEDIAQRRIQEDSAFRNSIMLDDGTIEKNLKSDPSKTFFQSLMGVIFVGKLKTYLKKHFITFDKMMEGHLCHSEDIFYRVEKTIADSDGMPTGDVIQNYWLPNSNDIDKLNFVDTQIKYGKHYAYRIYAYKAVVSTEYYYRELSAYDEGAIFVVTQRPKLLLAEEEIFLDDHIVLDDPPVPPEVEIVPFFANGKEILINLKSAVGEYLLDPVLLNLEDIGQHDDVRRSQKLDESDKIRFKGDDKGGSFEIYRIDFHPKSYEDFDNRLLKAVNNEIASTGECIDYISSNKKYYYTFRMVDVHGHVSNPTEVYEVELVNDEGSVFLNKRIVEMAPREPKNPSKSMRRLIEIKPSYEQGFLNTEGMQGLESALDVKDIKLGELEQSCWGKKYKFRIVSRKTGKKMDINIDFKAQMNRQSTLK